jgi:hypothetical protein
MKFYKIILFQLINLIQFNSMIIKRTQIIIVGKRKDHYLDNIFIITGY